MAAVAGSEHIPCVNIGGSPHVAADEYAGDLQGQPLTVEGNLYGVIRIAVSTIVSTLEAIRTMAGRMTVAAIPARL